MAKSKLTTCKACGAEIAKSAKSCPHCGAKNKKPIYKKWWFWVIIIILLSVIGSAGSGNDSKVDTVQNSTSEKSGNVESTTKQPAKTEYYVGDMIEDGNTKIVFMSSGEYAEDNTFMQPAEGKKYIYLQFAFENISKTADAILFL